jgi:hypothetical protein
MTCILERLNSRFQRVQGNQSGTTFNPGLLNPGTTYYWRVDQVNAQGTMTGDVWSFTTPGSGSNKVKIFILAGQSNMVGQGEMEPASAPRERFNIPTTATR